MRVIVAGTSPRILEDKAKELLKTGYVIGLNGTVHIPHVVEEMKSYVLADFGTNSICTNLIAPIMELKCLKYIRYSAVAEKMVFDNKVEGVVWFTPNKHDYPKRNFMVLGMDNNSATAGISLAKELGATEIVLVGVDFYDEKNAIDGVPVGYEGQSDSVNRFIRDCPMPHIYKTCEGPLQVPML